jgi:hypothetical protein
MKEIQELRNDIALLKEQRREKAMENSKREDSEREDINMNRSETLNDESEHSEAVSQKLEHSETNGEVDDSETVGKEADESERNHSETVGKEADESERNHSERNHSGMDSIGDSNNHQVAQPSEGMHSRRLGIDVHVAGVPTWAAIDVNMPACLGLAETSNMLPALQRLSMLTLKDPQNAEWRKGLQSIVTWAEKIRKVIDECALRWRLGAWVRLWSYIGFNTDHWLHFQGTNGRSWLLSHEGKQFAIEDAVIAIMETGSK